MNCIQELEEIQWVDHDIPVEGSKKNVWVTLYVDKRIFHKVQATRPTYRKGSHGEDVVRVRVKEWQADGSLRLVTKSLDRYILGLGNGDLSMAKSLRQRLKSWLPEPNLAWSYFSETLLVKKSYKDFSTRVQSSRASDEKAILPRSKSIGSQPSSQDSGKKGSKNALSFDRRKRVEKALKSLKREKSSLLLLPKKELAERLTKDLKFTVTSCNLYPLMKSLKIQTPRRSRERKASPKEDLNKSNIAAAIVQLQDKVKQIEQQLLNLPAVTSLLIETSIEQLRVVDEIIRINIALVNKASGMDSFEVGAIVESLNYQRERIQDLKKKLEAILQTIR